MIGHYCKNVIMEMSLFLAVAWQQVGFMMLSLCWDCWEYTVWVSIGSVLGTGYSSKKEIIEMHRSLKAYIHMYMYMLEIG